MTATLGAALERRAHEGFFGRQPEMTVLESALAPGGPRVVHISGAAGMGKSFLTANFAERSRNAGATVLRFDCRAIEPSEPGLLTALAAACGAETAVFDVIIQRLNELAGPVVLIFDTYEQFWLMDTFIRLRLCPVLPDSARVVMAGREPPVAEWIASPEWRGLFCRVTLGPLTERESLDCLGYLGMDPASARRVNAIAHGHPLALTIAGSAWRPVSRSAGRLRRGSDHVLAGAGLPRGSARPCGPAGAGGGERPQAHDGIAAARDAARRRPGGHL